MRNLIIRWIFTLVLLGLAYRETGVFTTIILLLLALSSELQSLMWRSMTTALQQLNTVLKGRSAR